MSIPDRVVAFFQLVQEKEFRDTFAAGFKIPSDAKGAPPGQDLDDVSPWHAECRTVSLPVTGNKVKYLLHPLEQCLKPFWGCLVFQFWSLSNNGSNSTPTYSPGKVGEIIGENFKEG
jgi:hypothetical protein